jgi:hypothetical protein
MKHRNEYGWFVGGAIAGFWGTMLLVAFSGEHSACRYQLLPASQLSSLRDCARVNVFYFGGWVLIGVAILATGFGVRALMRRGHQAVAESS